MPGPLRRLEVSRRAEHLRCVLAVSAFCIVMRTKAGNIEIPAYDRPQIWTVTYFGRGVWARWHTRLDGCTDGEVMDGTFRQL